MRKDWISSFYLSTKTTTNRKSVETYSYDEQVNICNNTNQCQILSFVLQDLIGAIGGYLGLFLGWSALSLVTAAPSLVKLVKQFMYKTIDV